MSASQEKKKRRDMLEDGAEPKNVKRQKSYAKRRRANITQTAIILVVIVLIIAVVIVNSSLFYTALPAVNIGGTNYTTAQFNYFYYSAYNSFASSYGDYLSYFGLDTSLPLKSQQYSEDQTWADYFEESALSTMRQITFLCDEAQKAGFALSQEGKDAVTASIEDIKANYAGYNYATVNQFVQAMYGKGATIDMVEDLMTKNYIASEYSQEIVDGYGYTGEELESYYTENKDTYDFISYRQYFFSGAADEEAGIDEETAMAEAKEQADAMVKAAVSEELFADLAYEYAAEDSKSSYEDPDSTLYRNQGQNLNTAFSEWLLDSERGYADCEVIDSTNGYYVIMYVGREDNHYNTRSARHILIKAEADEDGNYTDEAKQAAYDRAEEILDEWKAGDATEDSFAELANTYSEDGGSNTVGGLYEDIYIGQMVDEFEDFCFDEDRRYGDTGIVYGESTSYAGYHVMFYVGEGELYSDYLAENALKGEDYNAWLEAGLENYQVDTKFSFRFSK